MHDSKPESRNQSAPTPTPDRGAPKVSTGDVMLVQESLQVKGLYQGAVDGIPGSKTMRAVRAYKKQNNIPVNNQLTDDFVSHLRSVL